MKQEMNIAGAKVPSIAVYGIVIVLIYYAFNTFKNGIATGFRSLFDSDSETQKNNVMQDSFKILEKNPKIKAQMTSGNKSLADTLFTAMDGFGTDTATINAVFLKITTPEQMGAVFLSYGKRKLTAMYVPTHEGDLQGALNSECSQSHLMEIMDKNPNRLNWSIQMKLNWLQQFK